MKLTVFTNAELARLLKEQECYRRGLRDEFDRWDTGEAWACDLVAVTRAGPPNLRYDEDR